MDFFNKLSQKASETYKNTAEKTNKLAREVKIKSQINDNKNKIEGVYKEIGKKVYEKHIREENIDIKSELADECAKIDAYSKEIDDLQVEMRAIKDLRLCKVCAAEISLHSKFCPKCGAEQDELPVNIANMEVKSAQSQEVANAKPIEQEENNSAENEQTETNAESQETQTTAGFDASISAQPNENINTEFNQSNNN